MKKILLFLLLPIFLLVFYNVGNLNLNLTRTYELNKYMYKKIHQDYLSNWQYVEKLGLGINVNWMAFKRLNYYYFYWRNKTNICKLFKERGFDSVRIRVNSEVAFNEKKLRELKTIVEDCLKANLTVVISYSASEYLDDPTNLKNQEKFIEFWRIIAKEFKNYPYILSFDLITEPGKKAKKEIGLTTNLMKEAYKEIRKIDKKRVIIIPAPRASKPESLFYLLNFSFDNYSIVEWHIYAGGPCKEAKKIYYNNASYFFNFNKSYIEESFKIAGKFTNKTGIPTWIGAIRANCYPKNKKLLKKFYDGAPKGFYDDNKIEKFILFFCREAKIYKIPFSLNADNKFFDIENLNWYKSRETFLNKIIRCLKIKEQI